ncbi:MAG TPA: hypothetical protein VIA29_08220, partial [Thermoanaerobaculia bacterium]
GNSSATRTRMRRPGPRRFFQDAPLMGREEVSLERELSASRLRLRRLSRREGERAIDQMRAATAARYREFYTFTFADPRTVVSADVGRGTEILLVGVLPEKRLPLRSAYGGFIVRNGVPVGYIEGIAFGARIEMGVNIYYTFRNGESAWIYAQILRMFHRLLGVTSFSIDPYQIGNHNEEAIQSGAFWFYRKLGFRPTDRALMRLTEREEKKIAARRGYRTPARTLRRLAKRNILWEYPPSVTSPWDRFHIRNLGLAVDRRMAREFGGDAEKIRRASSRSVARKLGVRLESWSALEEKAFSDLALVLDLIPDLGRWPPDEKRHVVAVCRAKAGRDEASYLRLLQREGRLSEELRWMGSRTRSAREVRSGGSGVRPTYRCAAGKGKAPTFLDWIPAPDRGHLRLSDGTGISYRSETELLEICDGLARRRVAFSVGGILSPSPADLMSDWQEKGRIAISFLRIAWRRPEEWELHEIVPGVSSWEPCPPDALLAAPPQAVAVAKRQREARRR